ncbi:chloride intracellular channel protein 5-like [Schistocerca gregaria]|uniref:chloride intracellular channel protein 5-like n=1 Tax=Schistocerca gregaria TaxID=7010 RepID=UPI00211E158F|nr:chloride intracellular channel protein 5-like [Schistocerca gregaria]
MASHNSSDNQSTPFMTLYVRAGRDGRSLGACPDSQRSIFLAELKSLSGDTEPPLKYRIIPVCPSRPPPEFTCLGEGGARLRLPAAKLDAGPWGPESVVDSADDITALLEKYFPGGVAKAATPELEAAAELATRDMFSRFCYLVRGVVRDTSQLEAELRKADAHLLGLRGPFLTGAAPTLLDVEVLPKLHQARVAAHTIRGYEIPAELTGLWRWLHAAYSLPAFVASCPCDAEITLHWLDALGESTASPERRRQMRALYEGGPRFSLTVPVRATPVVIE